MDEELKPCPFCGNPGDKDPRHSFHLLGSVFCHVQCGDCSAMGPAVRPATNEHQAIAAWNRRLEPPRTRAPAQPEPAAPEWQQMAYARLGVIRDKMNPSDVEVVQRFLSGEEAAPTVVKQQPVAWANAASLASAKVSRERGGPFDTHTWSEGKTQHHDAPLYAATPPRAALTDEQIERLRGLDTDRRVRFYEHDFYVLSNFSAFALYWRGLRFDTSEAAYHFEKFPEYTNIQEAIKNADSAHEAFKISEKNKAWRRPDWDAVKVDVMRAILTTKARQHEYVRRKLLATGDRELVEDSWRDDFWGWGANRDGQNMLGKLWMEVRAELRERAHGITADRGQG